MRWIWVLACMACLLCMAASAEAKFVFRDGKWVFVADDEDLPPRETPVPTPAQRPQPPKQPARQPGPGQESTGPPTRDTSGENQPKELVAPGDPGPAAVALAESVGAKYRNPEASQAADEATRILGTLTESPASEADAVRSMTAWFREGQYENVAGSAKSFLKEQPSSLCAEAATWLRAEAIFTQGDYYPAFEAYEKFLDQHAGSRLADKALRREFECAEALLGPAKRKMLGLPLLSGEDEALAMLEKIEGRSPTGPLAPDAVLRVAEYRMEKGQFDEAEDQLRRFLELFPNHERARQAELMAGQCGMAANMGPLYDDTSLQRAKETLAAYEEKYPERAKLENVPGALARIRRQEAEKKLERARYYQRAREPKAAAFYAQRVIRDYRGTPAAAEAERLLKGLGNKAK